RFHDRAGTAGGHRAKLGGVTEHLAQRHFGFDDAGVTTLVRIDDHTAAAVEVTGDVADELFRRRDDDLHDRLQQRHAGLAAGLAEGELPGQFERHLARVHLVVAAV